MITFLTTARHRYTVDGYRKVWGASLAHVVQALPYERLFRMHSVPGGLFLFTDMDRLCADDLEKAAHWYQILKDAGATVLSDPGKFVGRLELLQRLHSSGMNQFSALTQDERNHARLPVFLRFAESHDGPKSDLIHDTATLDTEIERLKSREKNRRLILVEYLDYREPDERFCKYSHFRVGPQLIFAGMVCGRSWCRKEAESLDVSALGREFRAASDTRYNDVLMQCFETAGIEFGRIDYAIVDGRVQVFEINTNPDIGIPCPPGTERWKVRSRCYQQINEALWELRQSSNKDRRIETPGSFRSDYLIRQLGAWAQLLRKRARKALRGCFRPG